jgi:hypothetical protein
MPFKVIRADTHTKSLKEQMLKIKATIVASGVPAASNVAL